MSEWTYIKGIIEVNPEGRTQAEKTYLLETALNHLPIVSGSEEDMDIYTIQKNRYNTFSSTDEFGKTTNNLVDTYGHKNREGWLQIQDEYILVVDGALRDREFEQTYREFVKWVVRLGKRVFISDVFVKIEGYDKSTVIKNREIQNQKESWKGVFGGLFSENLNLRGKRI